MEPSIVLVWTTSYTPALGAFLFVYPRVRGHDPTPLGARPHIARHMNEWPTMKRSLV